MPFTQIKIYSGRNAIMHKNALKLFAFTAGASAFGAFFRWLQNQIIIEAETGLTKPSALNYVVPLVIALAAFLFWRLTVGLKAQELTAPESFYSAFESHGGIFRALPWILGAIMLVGGIMLRMTMRFERFYGWYAALSVLAILTGLCFPLICAAPRSRYSPTMVCVLMTVPIVFAILWLILSYRTHAVTPAVWVYAIEVLATAAALLTFYYIAGYAYGKARPYPTLFMLMLGAFMCVMTLADSRSTGEQLIFASCAGMFLLWAWIITDNIRPEPEKPAEQSPEETVIRPGVPDEPEAAPTIQAPDKRI